MIIALTKIEQMAIHRPAGYFEDVISQGTVIDNHLHLTTEAHQRLLAKYRPPNLWPLTPFGVAMRMIRTMRTPEDTGAGDTIARIIGPVGGDQYKKWFLEIFGRPCGCTERQEKINELFPYEKTP